MDAKKSINRSPRPRRSDKSDTSRVRKSSFWAFKLLTDLIKFVGLDKALRYNQRRSKFLSKTVVQELTMLAHSRNLRLRAEEGFPEHGSESAQRSVRVRKEFGPQHHGGGAAQSLQRRPLPRV
jgi:hypothetical protein